MSWIELPPDTRYAWPIRLLFAWQRRKFGQILEPVRLWGRTPRVFFAFLRLYRAFERKFSPLDAALRSLIMVRVSQINWCRFCIDMNAAHALARGIAEAKLHALENFADSPLFSEREKAALAFAEAMTVTGRTVDPTLRERLKAQFSDDAIIELAGLIAYQNMSSKFNAGLDVPAQGFCRLPE